MTPAGVASPPRRGDILKRLEPLIALVAAVIAIVLWATSALEHKADAGAFAATRDKVLLLEANERWLVAAVYALTQRAGVVVPPPPIPSP